MNRFIGPDAAATTRRGFLRTTLAAGAALSLRDALALPVPPADKYPVGTYMLELVGAKQAGLDGVQVPVRLAGDNLDVADAAVRAAYQDKKRLTGLPISSFSISALCPHPLASDPRGPLWLQQAIDAARELDARVILVPFFGKADLLTREGKVKQTEVDEVVKRLKQAAPRARDAGVLLAVENYLDASENLRILDRVGHASVQVYYDVYNTGVTRGYDVPAEIRSLKGRIAEFHFKNGPQFLGEGKLRFDPIADAVKETGYRGWIVLETSAPTKDPIADAHRNGEFVRRLFRTA
jgi:L-ribulose-5-phosphate 3-epimerase